MGVSQISNRRSRGTRPMLQQDDERRATATMPTKTSRNKSFRGSFLAFTTKMKILFGVLGMVLLPQLLERGNDAANGIMDSAASKYYASKSSNSNKMIQSNTTSFCLLFKDDDEILNEWIAYHYHVLNMRHLIIALDPTSRNPSPEPMLEKWRNYFGMNIDIWTDQDYMPQFFLDGHYDMAKTFVEGFEFANTNLQNNTERYQQELTIVNNHRFRQHTFVSYCLREFKKRLQEPKEGNWVAHVDTDEYIVMNPKILQDSEKVKPLVAPNLPSAGSILDYINQAFLHRRAVKLRRKCMLMPRILFIPRETDHNQKIDETNVWNVEHFETLRWRIHKNLTEPSGFQKAIMDVAAIPRNDRMFKENRIYNVHYPFRTGKADCPGLTDDPDINGINRYPLAVNHYIGSLERYLSRNDTRRHEAIWRRKEEMHGSEADGGWILGWLPSFVQVHGLEKVSQVLGDYQKEQFGLNV